ncbi:MAG: hypothetical protein ACJAZN_002032, partial [Planctomycetota bacterium]
CVAIRAAVGEQVASRLLRFLDYGAARIFDPP